ncbi:MAG: hypothetical protein PHN64_04015 [Desulfovibrionaceae bacterium]|nr:hypothetical protein [Desulfovibrionaceae bacterium]
MSTLEDIKKVLSRDICAEDVYERFVKPLEKNVNLLSEWAAEYANHGYEMKDAAEFEARVAEKIISYGIKNKELRPYCSKYDNGKRITMCPHGKDIIDCVNVLNNRRCLLRLARIAVEAEMEAEGK